MALFPLISSAFSFLDSCALVCTQRVVSIVESSLTAVCQELGWTTSGRVLQAGAEEEAQEGFEGLQEERGREGESEEDNRGEAQDLMEEGEEVDAGSAAAGGELPEGARSDPLQAADGWMGPAEPESQGEAQEEGLSMDTRSDDVLLPSFSPAYTAASAAPAPPTTTTDVEQPALPPQSETIFSQDDAFVTGGIFSDVGSADLSPFSCGDLPPLGNAASIPPVRVWGIGSGADGDTSGLLSAGTVSGLFDELFEDFSQPPLFFPTVEEVALIGEGNEGAVFHVKALDARGEWRDFAAKAEKQLEDGTYRNTLPGEARSLDAVRGDFCVFLEGYTVANGQLVLLLELADPGNRVFVAGRTLARARDLRWAAWVGEKVARGVAATHAAGFVHRDVKPDNVLLDKNGAPKLADFGAAATGERVAGLAYTHGYLPPEGYDADSQDRSGDVFAIGLTLWSIISGRTPTEDFDFPFEVKFHYAAGLRFSWPAQCALVGQPLLDAIEACWEHDPARRPSADQLARRLHLVALRLGHVAAREVVG